MELSTGREKWYHLDVTWDDPVPDVKGRLRYEYFLVKDSVMAEDHNWNKNAYPKCKSSSNSLISLFGTVTKNVSDASSVLASQYQNGNKKLTLILPTKASGADTFSMMSCLSDAASNSSYEGHSCSYLLHLWQITIFTILQQHLPRQVLTNTDFLYMKKLHTILNSFSRVQLSYDRITVQIGLFYSYLYFFRDTILCIYINITGTFFLTFDHTLVCYCCNLCIA